MTILDRFVDPSSIADGEHWLAFVETHLAEAKTLPDASALVMYLEPIAKKFRASHDRFVAAVPNLERAALAHGRAVERHAAAQAAHAQGSLIQKEALARRDELEVATQAERICARNLDDAVSEARGLVGGMVFRDPRRAEAQELIGAVALRVLNEYRDALKHPDSRTHRASLDDRWADSLVDVRRWEPLYAARVRAQSVAAAAAHEAWRLTKDFDARKIPDVMPIERFDAMLENLRAERENKVRALQGQIARLQETAQVQP